MARKLIVEIIGDSSSLEKTFKKSAAGADKFERTLGKTTRGVAAGSGAFKSLGRSLAFASGGFLAGASITSFLTSSIEQAQQAAVAQKQLSAQFKATGLNLRAYQTQIDRTVASISQLAGIEDDEVKAAFTLAFRATRNVAEGLRLTSIAADVARGRHIALAQATLALNKAYGGNVGALRRLGITIPTTLRGMQALEFVAGRFAGQAKAGTTAQERFNAAFVNTKQIIGAQLLPVFDRLLIQFTKFLNNPENQKRIQDDTKKTVEVFGNLAHAGGVLFGALGKAVHVADVVGTAFDSMNTKVNEAALGLAKAFLLISGSAQKTGEDIRNAALAANAFRPRTSEDIASAGAGSRTAIIPPTSSARGVAGFNARFAQLELALSKASLTQSQKDDRAILQQEAALIRERITKVKHLKDRTALYQQLGGIEQQIANIDQAAADKQKAANDKAVAAAQARRQRLKDQIKAIQQRFQDAIETARQGIGDLFAGPVKPDLNEANRRTLGLHTAPTGVGQLTADLRAQTKQAAQFQRNLQTLIKRGAPSELIRELRAAGVAGAGTQAQTLARASTPALRAFLVAFAKREKLALNVAKATMRTQLVTLRADRAELRVAKQTVVVHTTVNLDGKKISQNTTKHQNNAKRRTAAQRTGRGAGNAATVQ